MHRSTSRPPHRSSSLLAVLLLLALVALVGCGGDEATDVSTAGTQAPDTEAVSPEPTYEPAPEVINPENAPSDADPGQIAVEAATDEPGAATEEPQPAKSTEPDVS